MSDSRLKFRHARKKTAAEAAAATVPSDGGKFAAGADVVEGARVVGSAGAQATGEGEDQLISFEEAAKLATPPRR